MKAAGKSAQMAEFQAGIWLPQSREKVFGFFQSAENLQLLTPAWLDFKILTPLPIDMHEGTIIDYTLRLYGIRIKWQTRITEWSPPAQFADIQVKGPYEVWEHTHSFTEKDGGTLMRDFVRYKSPGGPLASIITRFFVSRDVRKIFAYRNEQITKIFSKYA